MASWLPLFLIFFASFASFCRILFSLRLYHAPHRQLAWLSSVAGLQRRAVMNPKILAACASLERLQCIATFTIHENPLS